MNISKQHRIELRKKIIGSKHDRKLMKYSDGFNEIFSFFLKCYRSELLDFCGSIVETISDTNEIEGKNTFRKYDNGDYQNGKPIITRHPNVVKAVIVGKKSWGLFINEWSDGIIEGSFTKKEILEEFSNRNINIPDSLLLDFENRIITKFKKRYLK